MKVVGRKFFLQMNANLYYIEDSKLSIDSKTRVIIFDDKISKLCSFKLYSHIWFINYNEKNNFTVENLSICSFYKWSLDTANVRISPPCTHWWDALRSIQHHLGRIPVKYVKPKSSHEETSDKIKLRNILQNHQSAVFLKQLEHSV